MTEHPQSRWLSLIGIALLTFTAFLDFTIVNTSLPFIQRELHANVIQLQWVTNIFAMMMSMFMIIAGKAGDLFGRNKIFFGGVAIFTVGAIGAALSPTIQVLILFRAVQGLGGAIVSTVSTAMISQLFPTKEQPKAIGIYSAITGLGLAIGPFLGGLLMHWFSWRAVFWVNLPVIVFGLLLCMQNIAGLRDVRQAVKLDLIGALLLILTLGLLIFGIINGGQFGWNQYLPWTCIVAGLIFLASLIFVELKTKDPLLDFHILNKKLVLLAMLNCSAAGIVAYVMMFIDPLYLGIVRDLTPFYIGLIMVAAPVMQVALSFNFNRLVDAVGVDRLLVFSIFIGLVAAIFHVFIHAESSYLLIVVALLLMGFTWCVANAGTITAATQSIDHAVLGAGIGTIFTLWNISGSIYLAIASVLIHNKEQSLGVDPDHVDMTTRFFKNVFFQGYHTATWFSVVVCLICLVLALLVHKTYRT